MSTLETGLASAHAEVKAEIARTDTKTGLLLAFIGAVLAVDLTCTAGALLTIAALITAGGAL